jgi:hypothetical protein
MVGVENNRTFLDRIAGVRLVRPDNAETEIEIALFQEQDTRLFRS